MQMSVTPMVIRRPRQNSSAYSAMMSARNHPNQSTGSIGCGVAVRYCFGSTGGSALNHCR